MRPNPEFLRRGYLKKQSPKPAFGRKSEALSSKPVLSNVERILNKRHRSQMTDSEACLTGYV